MKCPVKLNVGGKNFISSKETLESPSLISTILNNPAWKGEEEIIYFDKDPKVFSYVLNLLRNEISLDDVPKKRYKQILKQLDYFGVDVEIEDKIEKVDKKEKEPLFKVLQNNVDLEKEVASISKFWNRGKRYYNLKEGDNLLGFKIHNPHGNSFNFRVDILCPKIGCMTHLRTYSTYSSDLNSESITIPLNILLLRDADIIIETSAELEISFLFGIFTI